MKLGENGTNFSSEKQTKPEFDKPPLAAGKMEVPGPEDGKNMVVVNKMEVPPR